MSKQDPEDNIQTFIERLGQLDQGQRARLKRNRGKTLGEARGETLALFYQLLPHGIPEYLHETYFLAATLFPLLPNADQGDFGESLRQVRTEFNAKGLDRRMEVLLDADETQLAFRLRQAVHFLQKDRTPVNWGQMLEDLTYWNHPSRFVQKRWARSYFEKEVPGKKG